MFKYPVVWIHIYPCSVYHKYVDKLVVIYCFEPANLVANRIGHHQCHRYRPNQFGHAVRTRCPVLGRRGAFRSHRHPSVQAGNHNGREFFLLVSPILGTARN